MLKKANFNKRKITSTELFEYSKSTQIPNTHNKSINAAMRHTKEPFKPRFIMKENDINSLSRSQVNK